ncbi:helix-turn-helix domain-containing protein [Methylobacterium pseudosasicola]|uniref:histidine kinase n=1 Tax=Methylobacterium pseudosasicola TaxID=582667 RepID=A0A1I4RQQ3_9HYPH|nr:helix-turn-helix transcriptional regulator [Methylobacterium pseudosasicola]SFM54300.1 Helix-turn-helix domain-containing protein [Methylobacterium pseudosasicola]
MFHSALSALTFSSGEFLTITESRGLSGAWSWVLAGGEQIWSPGFFRLLGLVPNAAKANYDLLLSLVHPEDRHLLPSLGEVRQGHVPRETIVRVIRPNGTMRVLSLVMEARFSGDGRPVAVNGTALDVTDREQLAQMRQLERRRRGALYLTEHITCFSIGLDNRFEIPFEVAQVHGLPYEEICTNPYLMIVPEERGAFQEAAQAQFETQQFFQGTAHERLANGELWHFRIVSMPVRDPDGTYLGRCGLKCPVRSPMPISAALNEGLDQAVSGHHLRAARALLDWSMMDLAQASGLSHSTVRRLEEGSEHRGSRSLLQAVASLRRAGIRFILMDDGTLAVAKG